MPLLYIQDDHLFIYLFISRDSAAVFPEIRSPPPTAEQIKKHFYEISGLFSFRESKQWYYLTEQRPFNETAICIHIEMRCWRICLIQLGRWLIDRSHLTLVMKHVANLLKRTLSWGKSCAGTVLEDRRYRICCRVSKVHSNSFTQIRPENMTDSISITLGFERERTFLLWLFWAGSAEGHRGWNCKKIGEKRKKWFTAKSEWNEEEEVFSLGLWTT